MAALDQIRDKWQAITPREQRMVLLLGVSFVLVMIIYVALEIRDGLGTLEAKNQKARRALAALTAYKSQAQSTGPSDDPVNLITDEGIKLEIFHHPPHRSNLERMMAGMKASLDYYTAEFGPFPYGELRILESKFGHVAGGPNRIAEDTAFVEAAIRELLVKET